MPNLHCKGGTETLSFSRHRAALTQLCKDACVDCGVIQRRNNSSDTGQCYLTTNSYVFYKVANSYDLTGTILYNLSRPQWRVGHSYEFIQIGELVKK